MNEDEFNEGWGSTWGEDESPFNIWDEDDDGAGAGTEPALFSAKQLIVRKG